jgi:alpha-beta hydrolase superfamily lysophospholipase
MRRLRTVNVDLPAESGHHAGLAYTLWLPPARPAAGTQTPAAGGVVILHGAGSSKESHYDFARMVVGAGLGAICFDQRGHGESEGALDARAGQDVAAMAELLRERLESADAPVAFRGSSMGGYLAIASAELGRAAAVVAICPAAAELLRAGLRRGALKFDADPAGLDAFLAEHDLDAAASGLTVPVLLLHAEGDERVPVEHSRELAKQLGSPDSRLVVVPGGHHRSVQHDRELQAVSLRFIERVLAGS